MKVYVRGGGEITLSKADFVGGGGEGNVYAKGNTGIKVYHDPSKMLAVGKITELATITDADIIKPEKVVLDKANHPIGYTMRFLRNTLALCQLFPPAFRQRSGITPQMTLDLVLKLQERVRNTHKAGILVVDLNEMNYLVDAGFHEVYAIDVDSYQTRSYPATAIMPSVRDPQVKNLDWSELSDWFSFACVAFNLFTGIHPYKGKHPSIKGLEDRMSAGVSVFNAQVKVPKVVLPFTVIPETYRQWFRAVLEEGKRLPPPGDLHGVIIVTPIVRTITGTDKLDIGDLWAYSDAVRGLWDYEGGTLVWTDDGLYIEHRRVHGPVQGVGGVGFAPKTGRPVVAGTSGGMLKLLDVTTGTEVPVNLRADAVMSHRGNLYVKSGSAILGITLIDTGTKIMASPASAGTCLEHATKLFPGVAVQNLLGKTWVSVYPKNHWVYQFALPELDAYKVIEARFDNDTGSVETGVLMVLGAKGGQYDRLVFRFEEKYRSYDVRKVEDVTPTGLNFVVLDTGVCACLNEDEKLELFSVRKGYPGVKLVEDPVLGGDMHLTKQGGRVVFTRGSRVQTVRMK